MRFSILAAIGQVESTNASGHHIGDTGDITPPIVGPRLDGSGAGGNLTPVYDTDGGVLDEDSGRPRRRRPAVPARHLGIRRARRQRRRTSEPAQRLRRRGRRRPALRRWPRDLDDPEQLTAALLAYNNLATYVAQVMEWIGAYDQMAAAAPSAQSPAARHR